jgi:hypothetical protein
MPDNSEALIRSDEGPEYWLRIIVHIEDRVQIESATESSMASIDLSKQQARELATKPTELVR